MSTEGSKLWPIKLNKLTEQRLKLLQQSALFRFMQLLDEEGIEPSTKITSMLAELYLPLADWLISHKTDLPLVVGINGAQGSGKTTLSKILASLLDENFDKQVVVLSIDDFYLSRDQRKQLADKVHPLFITRGVPGTHDVSLMKSTLNKLRKNQPGELLLPVFDKALDDQLPEVQWKKIQLPVDIILFEGWCVGAVAEDEVSLAHALNSLEAEEDKECIWRSYVNGQLALQYKQLFTMLDVLLMIEVPSYDKVYEWRLLQESKLSDKALASIQQDCRIMSENEIRRFIMHFERITRHVLEEMPSRADIVLQLNNDHLVHNVIFNSKV